jgi:HSP20 family protein
MNIIKYNPNTASLLDWGFDNLIDRFFGDSVFTGMTGMPRVDLKETDANYVLEAELPGLTEKDFEVKIENDLLTLSSVKKTEKEEKKDKYLYRERSESSFKRSFVVPKDADVEKVDARYANGILTLTIGTSEKAKPKTIEVKIN